MRSGSCRITHCSSRTCISSPTKLRLGCGKSIAAKATASAGSRTRKRRCSSTGSSAIRMVDDAVEALDLDRTESGFSWYRMFKLEHQFVNSRHIQHHGAQLIDRVRSAADIGVRWVAARQRNGESSNLNIRQG